MSSFQNISSKLLATNRSNPCDLCGDITGKCRKAGNLNLCMTLSGKIEGYRYLGQSKDGLWGKYVLDDGEDLSQEDWERRWQEQRILREQRAQVEAQRHAQSLPAIERDRLYRQLLDQLTLHPADRADLHRRGFTNEQIQDWGVKSVEQWQPLSGELPHDLPGINLDGKSLNTPRPGYLCPIMDADGQIVGFQIRSRSSEGGRYFWLTGKTRKRPNGPTPHLRNGELPLAIHRPEQITRDAFALVEGTGAKPHLLAQRMGQVTIGAAGGLFAASPETLKATLAQLGITTIEFYPDAGAIQNKSVLRQYRSTWALLKEWGYTVTVAWWKQTDKRIHTDIDELDDLSQIQYLSVADFERIAAQCNGLLHQLQQALSKLTRPSSPAQGFATPNDQQTHPTESRRTKRTAPDEERLATLPATSRRARRSRRRTARLLAAHRRHGYISKLRLENYRSRIRRRTAQSANSRSSSLQSCPGDNGTLSPTTPLVHEYQPGQRLQTWETLISSGFPYILDQSQPGTGKSYDSGNVTPIGFGMEQVIYLSDQHRNPTVSTLEQGNGWCDLEARHGGLNRVKNRLQRSAKGDAFAVPANCSRIGVLNALRDKNIPGADTANLICGTCIAREACINADGPGYGFLNQRRNVLGTPLLRAHPDSLPDPEDYPLENTMLIWDEPGQNFQVKQSVTVTFNDLQQTISGLIAYPEIFALVQPLLSALLPLMDGSEKLGKYGLNHLEMKAKLPDMAGVKLGELTQVLMPNLGFLNTTSDYGVDLADLPKQLRKKFSERDSEMAEQARNGVVKQWLIPLIRILQGGAGCIQVSRYGLLTLNTPNPRHRDLAQAAQANVFLDATLSREDLALKLGCSPDEILVVRQAVPDTGNLEVIQVKDMGRVGMSRGGDQTKRIGALAQHYQDLDAVNTRTIDFKKFEKDGAWWRDSRGVNDFLTVQTLVLVGTPCRNLNDLAAEFAIVCGYYPEEDNPAFTAFIDRSILAEIHQAIGRLRAHRRPHESLQVVLISNIEMDCFVQEVQAKELTLDAAHKTERVEIAIESAILQLQAKGEKVTQQIVSAMTQIPRGTIARYWRLFISLLKGLNSKMNNLCNAPNPNQETHQAIAGVLDELADLPVNDLLPSLNEVFFDWLKPKEWSSVWSEVSASGQMAILEGLAMTLPVKMLERGMPELAA
ncbi:hypothetical protein AM1_C0040 (plasmid) [Acaryochloris marina MBIC11017]|uniref:DUF3854 domain-containing protein n=2 Tax=Acaryochloris marina TaxID=155978 RepID=A8ZMD9_ACAM1|nr:hypothetical protein [Acaryochloris marina]ABW32350.1 hypothetical protein AM1_C0040 [Acaryochloris marina MBIC11017]